MFNIVFNALTIPHFHLPSHQLNVNTEHWQSTVACNSQAAVESWPIYWPFYAQ